MKSAYERAMEKMQGVSGPLRELSETQRSDINDIEAKCDAQIAQINLDYDDRMSQATTAAELQTLRAERGLAVKAVEDKREREKNAIWDQS